MSKKALVVLSGGQDSATCLALAERDFDEVYAVSFDYGQRHIRELECAKELCKLAGVKEHRIVDLTSAFSSLNSVSALTDPTMDISESHPLNEKLPASFVPGRNYLFLGFAAVVAYNLKIEVMFAGMNDQDFSGYPDCRKDTILSIQESLTLSCEWNFVIATPLMLMGKRRIVEMMGELGRLDWYRYTMTCYNGQYPPCGTCPSCKLRAKGFKEAGIADPLFDYKYEGMKLL